MTPSRNDAEILRRRASILARPLEPERPGSGVALLEFVVAGQSYAFETRHLAEVLPLRDLTPVPGTPDFIAGIANLRGLVVAVLDLHEFLEIRTPGLADLRHLVRVRGASLDLCLLAATVKGVRQQPLDELLPVPPGLAGRHPEQLRGMTGEGLVVLDIDRMLADPRLGESHGRDE